jgi:hypothetical protein
MQLPAVPDLAGSTILSAPVALLTQPWNVPSGSGTEAATNVALPSRSTTPIAVVVRIFFTSFSWRWVSVEDAQMGS